MGEAAGALQTAAAAQPAARALAFGEKELLADTPTDSLSEPQPQLTAAPKFVERSAAVTPLDEPQTPGAGRVRRRPRGLQDR